MGYVEVDVYAPVETLRAAMCAEAVIEQENIQNTKETRMEALNEARHYRFVRGRTRIAAILA